ncbi:D-isomer specific 2-hydroxyacid dehydrogenase family protein [Derxia gummosa]|uniref:D-isomer specific 2-hydroxyacid dehydrogenase family protein n=1 Tax=Derxia gummosa DSM 723 TaxID=1121388 RepID=A0A8B6X3Z5_9BURK|nr:D-isomer specific 2-hydroxyacid dehydrogenase family protein [Derxia gummosa]
MSEVIVASQHDERVNDRLRERAPALRVLAVPPGPVAELPEGASVLFSRPHPGWKTAPAPVGWPFDLRWVQLSSVGIDWYPGWLFDGPVVTCARGTSSSAIAEYVLAAILAVAKDIPNLWVHSPAEWKLRSLGAVEGTTLGLIGFGSIGRAVAKRALAFGMKVIALRRGHGPSDVDGVEIAGSAVEVFARADHVVLAAPATEETWHLVNRHLLATARPGLHLINVARGSLVDHEALLAALDSGRLSRATLDVTDPEPLPAGHPLWTHPRVRLSPHSSPGTPALLDAVADRFLQNLARFRAGETLAEVVDPARGY